MSTLTTKDIEKLMLLMEVPLEKIPTHTTCYIGLKSVSLKV